LSATDDSPAGNTLRGLLRHKSFTRFLVARFTLAFALQMQTVGVGIQVYALTHDPLDLGLLGLSQFLPFVLLVLFAGQAADRWDRRRIALGCFAVELGCALALVYFTHAGMASVTPVFAIMIVFGAARAVMAPAVQALMPNLVPLELFGRAVAVNSSMWQVATIAGPALGGLVYAAAGPGAVYAATAALIALSVVFALGVAPPPVERDASAAGWRALVQGLGFVWRRKSVLGAISLDLFAVLFGGATALLPAYAVDVLHVGPVGLGWLRAAPGVGAALMAVGMVLRPLARHAGRAMFGGIVLFGLATIVFGFSTLFPLSFAALLVLGAADMISVFVRGMLVQLKTPDAMRGRVSAVSWMSIGASNELGEFESGITAAWWGLVPAVVVGGVATLLVAALWARWFPELRRMDRFAQT
jgi:MFS family permease